jgi:hypothetical protein
MTDIQGYKPDDNTPIFGCPTTWPPHPQPAQTIRASLTGSNKATAGGIAATGSAPVLTLCRQLLAAGLDPDTALDVYRKGTLALRIKSIGKAANLTIEDDGQGKPVLRRFRDRADTAGAAPPMRKNEGRRR